MFKSSLFNKFGIKNSDIIHPFYKIRFCNGVSQVWSEDESVVIWYSLLLKQSGKHSKLPKIQNIISYTPNGDESPIKMTLYKNNNKLPARKDYEGVIQECIKMEKDLITLANTCRMTYIGGYQLKSLLATSSIRVFTVDNACTWNYSLNTAIPHNLMDTDDLHSKFYDIIKLIS